MKPALQWLLIRKSPNRTPLEERKITMKKMIFAALVAMLAVPFFASCAKEEPKPADPAAAIKAAASTVQDAAPAVKAAASEVAK